MKMKCRNYCFKKMTLTLSASKELLVNVQLARLNAGDFAPTKQHTSAIFQVQLSYLLIDIPKMQNKIYIDMPKMQDNWG